MKRYSRGFTLIELLVVIAIIAILAAILFPVFAAAKGAAKKAASISNSKQLTLGVIMYQGDSDDMLPKAAMWNPQDSPGSCPFGFGNGWVNPWTNLCAPYIKNGDIFYDPQAPSSSINPGDNAVLAAMVYPNYGYNYVYLSAWDGTRQTVVNGSSIAKPSETVLLSAKWSRSETDLSSGTILGFQFDYAHDGPLLNMTVEAPNCNEIPQYCVTNWGKDGFGSAKTVESGRDTGANSVRAGKACVVSWIDGHTSAMQPGRLAQGTNWSPTIATGDLHFNTGWEGVYLWDLL